jgi:hypothetical protein
LPRGYNQSAGGVVSVCVRGLLALCAIALIASGCLHSHPADIAADLPPSPRTWPPYPDFSQRSCWAKPTGRWHHQSAPSFAPTLAGTPTPPVELVRRLLERFGDRTFIRRLRVGPPPPARKLRIWFQRPDVPKDALWAYISVPSGTWGPLARTPRGLAEWEAHLVWGALRDDFCAAGGRPLAGWSLSGQLMGISRSAEALNQRFPNPTPDAFRARVAAVGRRYGFRAASVRLLRPRQLAPLVTVETKRDRTAFVRDLAAISMLLNPISHDAKGRIATTFEAFFFEARDPKGLFLEIHSVGRGDQFGGSRGTGRCAERSC